MSTYKLSPRDLMTELNKLPLATTHKFVPRYEHSISNGIVNISCHSDCTYISWEYDNDTMEARHMYLDNNWETKCKTVKYLVKHLSHWYNQNFEAYVESLQKIVKYQEAQRLKKEQQDAFYKLTRNLKGAKYYGTYRNFDLQIEDYDLAVKVVEFIKQEIEQ